MKYLILFSLLISPISYSQSRSINPRIKTIECKMWSKNRSQARIFTLHENYSLLVPFDTLNAFIVADHKGNAGARGDGNRYILFVKDPNIGGYVQGASSSTIKSPLALQDISFEDPKYGIRVRCKGR